MSASTAEAVPLVGDVIVRTHDGSRCVAWTLGTGAVTYGLTVDGITAAAKATAEFFGSLDASEKQATGRAAGVTRVVIGTHEWLVPLVPGRAADIEALMIGVVNAEGSLGRVS